MPGMPGFMSLPEPRAEPRTQTGLVVYWRAFSALTRMAAEAPSPVGAHMRRVRGSATSGEFRISSTV